MRSAIAAAAFAALALVAIGPTAQAKESGVKLGVLQCSEAGGWGFVFGSSRAVNCTFSPTPARVERYVGKIQKFGVDIGYQRSGVLVWAVLAPTTNIAPGALAGGYGGLTAGASVAIGASANALIGGSDRTIALQPLSIEGTTGLNVAAGIGALTLTYVPSSYREGPYVAPHHGRRHHPRHY